jgi:hypothetical protein
MGIVMESGDVQVGDAIAVEIPEPRVPLDVV